MTVIGEAFHPLAVVDREGCEIGLDCTIWQFASVIRKARLGNNCTIAANAIVDGAWLGDGCLVGHAASIHPGTKLGNNVFVGPGAIFCNDMWPRTDKTGFQYPPREAWTIIAEDGASIGAGAIILPGVVIGKGAMVAAGVVCSQPVRAGHILRRDGTMEVIPEGTEKRRMRFAV